MTTALTTTNGADIIESVMLAGDLMKLSAPQRVSYYKATCESLHLNPLTKPFEFITLNGKLVMYATRNCTDQLRKIHGISIRIVSRERLEDIYVVTAQASLPDGRMDESIGAVPIANLKGEALANALMKAETKAKRRATLCIVGLSFSDETEVDSIPNAQRVHINTETGEVQGSAPALTAQVYLASDEQREELRNLTRMLGYSREQMDEIARDLRIDLLALTEFSAKVLIETMTGWAEDDAKAATEPAAQPAQNSLKDEWADIDPPAAKNGAVAGVTK